MLEQKPYGDLIIFANKFALQTAGFYVIIFPHTYARSSGDRVAHSECEGRGFESRRAYQIR